MRIDAVQKKSSRNLSVTMVPQKIALKSKRKKKTTIMNKIFSNDKTITTTELMTVVLLHISTKAATFVAPMVAVKLQKQVHLSDVARHRVIIKLLNYLMFYIRLKV